MKHLIALNDEIIWGSPNGKCNMCAHTCITLKRNEDINGFLLYIKIVFGSLNAI